MKQLTMDKSDTALALMYLVAFIIVLMTIYYGIKVVRETLAEERLKHVRKTTNDTDISNGALRSYIQTERKRRKR